METQKLKVRDLYWGEADLNLKMSVSSNGLGYLPSKQRIRVQLPLLALKQKTKDKGDNNYEKLLLL